MFAGSYPLAVGIRRFHAEPFGDMGKTSEALFTEALKEMVKEGASDLYLKPGRPPILRIDGQTSPMKTERLSPEDTQNIANQLMNEIQRARFQKESELNLIYAVPDTGRFRINLFKQRGLTSLVLRRIREDIPSFEQLHLPPVLKEIAMFPRGLVLVTGQAGSGKTTTLASMIDEMNEKRSGHILTLEDPIEFLHPDKNCLVSQREIGVDTLSFAEALKNAVRQTPDVILIGEMRDPESVSSAAFFSETGHLVLSSLHASSSSQALERMLNFFPTEVHSEMLMQFSLNIRAVICQRLIPRSDGKGRVPAVEVLLNNARFRELFRKGEFVTVKREIDLFQNEGMQSMDTALLKLVQDNLISMEMAMSQADSKGDMRLKAKAISAEQQAAASNLPIE